MRKDKNEKIVIYKDKKGLSLSVRIDKETAWLTQKEMAMVFGTKVPAISKHVKNVYEEKELDKKTTISKTETVQKEGNRYVKRQSILYNLDVIIAIGYRVNSKKATQFRIWATQVLRNHIIQGYTINQKRLMESDLSEFTQAVSLIRSTRRAKRLKSGEAKGLLEIITEYAYTWLLLHQYDKDKLEVNKLTRSKEKIGYDETKDAIEKLKEKLIEKRQASQLFGNEQNKKLDAIVNTIY